SGSDHVVQLPRWIHDMNPSPGLCNRATDGAAEALSHVTQEGDDAVFYDTGVRIILMDRDVDSLTGEMFTLL
ncbi:hypothetical protein, partial [uncultured Mameliella sp.]|uniref:hypothetical protein n=2 Tax=uncultured Mameliella sp. TaxID=1447087 RepID=UPI00260ACB2B